MILHTLFINTCSQSSVATLRKLPSDPAFDNPGLANAVIWIRTILVFLSVLWRQNLPDPPSCSCFLYRLFLYSVSLSAVLNPKRRRIKIVQRVLLLSTIKNPKLSITVCIWDLILGEIIQYNMIHNYYRGSSVLEYLRFNNYSFGYFGNDYFGSNIYSWQQASLNSLFENL